jgi:hypothetical protein
VEDVSLFWGNPWAFLEAQRGVTVSPAGLPWTRGVNVANDVALPVEVANEAPATAPSWVGLMETLANGFDLEMPSIAIPAQGVGLARDDALFEGMQQLVYLAIAKYKICSKQTTSGNNEDGS